MPPLHEEAAMPLHTTTARTPRRAKLTRAAIIVAAAGIIGGGAAIAATDGETAAPDRSISRYADIEANKANSMRALGVAMMQESSPYRDLEANKARSQRAR
jgi:hypothetical protein